jgi:hypothetical protein
MMKLEFVRGRYFNGDREIENITEEAHAMVQNKPCAFCESAESEAVLIVADPDEKKVHTIPTCKCIANELPTEKSEEEGFIARLKELDLASMSFFRIEPGPVLRFDSPPATVAKYLGDMMPTEGRLADLSKVEHIRYEHGGCTITIFPTHNKVLMTKLNRAFQDEVQVMGSLDYSDGSRIISAITTEGENTTWAKELLYWRLNEAVRRNNSSRDMLASLLGGILGGDRRPDPDCDCPDCTTSRKEKRA